MSEYQYYEFRAIDRPLDLKAMDELRALSTRAEITPSSLTNTYHYGDFKGNPLTLMDRYFDAFLYVANWGTRRLMFRVPRRFLDIEATSAYCDGEVLSIKDENERHFILEFSIEGESDVDWEEGERWMSSLISLRADLMRGDYRALYLGWLASLQNVYLEDVSHEAGPFEPPVPPGLAKLSAPLRELAEFLRVDDEWIEVAASGSAGEPPAEPSHDEVVQWIKSLPVSDKNAYLLRFFDEDGDLRLRADLSNRFRDATAPKGSRPAPKVNRRSAAELLAAYEELSIWKNREEAELKAKEQARLAAEKALARSKHLDSLALRESATWLEVEALIAAKRAQDYDRAVGLLVDLRELAGRSGRVAEADERISELRRRHSNKPSLLKRFDAANFMKLG